MNTQDIISFLSDKNKYEIVNTRRQIWSNEKYSYTETPRPCCGILYVTEGIIKYSHNDLQLKAQKGDLILLPENSNYQAFFQPKNGRVIDLLVNFQIERLDKENLISFPFLLIRDTPSQLVSIFDNMIQSYNDENLFLTNSYFYLLLNGISLHIQNEANDRTYTIIQKSKELLKNQPNTSISKIAAICNINENSFRQIFKKYTGMTPVQYRTAVKINTAKNLLSSTDIPIKEISLMLDFFDESYFYKIFCKAVGMTPMQFRKKS